MIGKALLALLALSGGAAMAQTAAPERTVLDLFAGVSPDGRRILTEALRDNRTPAERDAAARARRDVHDALGREPFDRAAVEAAMQAEDRLLDAERAARRTALLDAYGRLSPSDRRAYVQASRALDARRGMMRAP